MRSICNFFVRIWLLTLISSSNGFANVSWIENDKTFGYGIQTKGVEFDESVIRLITCNHYYDTQNLTRSTKFMAITTDGSVYSSPDDGFTWLSSSIKVDIRRIDLYQHGKHREDIILRAIDEIFYSSQDCGISFNRLNYPSKVQSF